MGDRVAGPRNRGCYDAGLRHAGGTRRSLPTRADGASLLWVHRQVDARTQCPTVKLGRHAAGLWRNDPLRCSDGSTPAQCADSPVHKWSAGPGSMGRSMATHCSPPDQVDQSDSMGRPRRNGPLVPIR